MVEKGQESTEKNQAAQQAKDLGDDILKLLSERTPNPSEAFVLMQQLSIYLWSNYKIDWQDHEGRKVAATRKQRYLDFISGLIDAIATPEDQK